MKFKLDENFGPTVLAIFQSHGVDCHTVGDENLSGADDPDVLAAAVTEQRILVTLDRDFSNVFIYPPNKTSGIAVLVPGRRASRNLLALMVQSFLSACDSKLIHGKLWIVEPGRIREHRIDDADEPT